MKDRKTREEYMFVSCVHTVAVLNTAFCMTYSLLMVVENARGAHMEETYSIPCLMTGSHECLLPHLVAVSAFIICRNTTIKIDDKLSKRRLPTDCQKGEKILRVIILKAASHHIPSGRH